MLQDEYQMIYFAPIDVETQVIRSSQPTELQPETHCTSANRERLIEAVLSAKAKKKLTFCFLPSEQLLVGQKNQKGNN